MLILLLSTLSCWIFAMLWLIFGKISQIILPIFLFLFGTLLISIAIWMTCVQRRERRNINEQLFEATVWQVLWGSEYRMPKIAEISENRTLPT